MAAFEPRIVQLIACDPFVDGPRTDIPGQLHVPSILHTTQEARSEGLCYYTLCYEKPTLDASFPTLFDTGTLETGAKENTIFVNFEVDTFLHKRLPGNTTVPNLESYTLEKADPQELQIVEVRSRSWRYSVKAIEVFRRHALKHATHTFVVGRGVSYVGKSRLSRATLPGEITRGGFTETLYVLEEHLENNRLLTSGSISSMHSIATRSFALPRP